MRLCVFVWSSLTLPVLGRLKPRSLCEEATSAFVSWPVCLRLHLCVFTWILCAFLELRVSLLTGSVCQEGGGVGGVGGTVALLRQTQDPNLRASQRERGPLSCDCAFHQGTDRQRHKTRHVSPPSSLPSTTTTPALPSVPSLYPSPLSVTLTFIKKPHAGIPFQHLSMPESNMFMFYTHTHTSLWEHCMELIWLWLFKMALDKSHFAIKEPFCAVMKPSVAWNFCHRGPRCAF